MHPLSTYTHDIGIFATDEKYIFWCLREANTREYRMFHCWIVAESAPKTDCGCHPWYILKLLGIFNSFKLKWKLCGNLLAPAIFTCLHCGSALSYLAYFHWKVQLFCSRPAIKQDFLRHLKVSGKHTDIMDYACFPYICECHFLQTKK